MMGGSQPPPAQLIRDFIAQTAGDRELPNSSANPSERFNMPPTLYLIDGHALAYRMYFALTSGGPSQRWRTPAANQPRVLMAFRVSCCAFSNQEKPDYLAVAFDTGKTFRDEIFPEYKATRAKMPDDLRLQIERIRQVVDAFNIPRLEMEGFEADDVLGSAAQWAARQGLGVKIITGDRDLLQLVGQRIIVYLAGDDQNHYPRGRARQAACSPGAGGGLQSPGRR